MQKLLCFGVFVLLLIAVSPSLREETRTIQTINLSSQAQLNNIIVEVFTKLAHRPPSATELAYFLDMAKHDYAQHSDCEVPSRERGLGLFCCSVLFQEELERTLLETKPRLAIAVGSYFDERHSLYWNLEYNEQYGVALFVAAYLLRSSLVAEK